MTAPTRDEVRKMARESGTPEPMVFSAAYERLVATAYAKGQEDMRDTIMDEWDSRIQADLEHGVRSLNEKAAAEWRKVYPAMADFSNAIRALPIQKGGEE